MIRILLQPDNSAIFVFSQIPADIQRAPDQSTIFFNTLDGKVVAVWTVDFGKILLTALITPYYAFTEDQRNDLMDFAGIPETPEETLEEESCPV